MGVAVRRRWMMQGAACALAVCAVAWSAAGRADDAAAPSQWQGPVAFDAKGDTIPVRPLDDPANPYRGQYSEVEQWLVAHSMGYEQMKTISLAYHTQIQAAMSTGSDYPDSPLASLRTTPEGWLVPLTQPQYPGQADWRQGGKPILDLVQPMGLNQQKEAVTPYFAIAADATAMPAELRTQLEYAQYSNSGRTIARIPAWLGSRPPLRAIFVPNGDIVAYGELNLHYQTKPGGPSHYFMPVDIGGETWYRYSADGQLLGKLTGSAGMASGSDWMKLYWPARDTVLRPPNDIALSGGTFWKAVVAYPPGLNHLNPTWPDNHPVKLLQAYSYTGQPLDVNGTLPAELDSIGRELDQHTLGRLYQLQVQLGLTDPKAASPFEGQPNGPQAVDPAPRPRPVVAGATSGGGRMIKVLPRDSADNQYRGAYGKWDDWVWQQHEAHNPKERQAWASGETPPQPEPINFYGSWRSVWLPVDASGALLPLPQVGQAEARMQLDYDRRDERSRSWEPGEYQFYAGGELDDAQWTELEAQRLSRTKQLYPAIPPWLTSQPAAYVVFVPNGDIVTLGPLGSFDDAPDTKFEARYKAGANAPMYVYGPDGQPKGTIPAGQDWTTFYAAKDLQAKLDAARAAGQEVATADGYTLVYSGPRYSVDAAHHMQWLDPQPTLLAAYDWDGTPVDFSQPLTRSDFHCQLMEWYQVKWVHDVRALTGE